MRSAWAWENRMLRYSRWCVPCWKSLVAASQRSSRLAWYRCDVNFVFCLLADDPHHSEFFFFLPKASTSGTAVARPGSIRSDLSAPSPVWSSLLKNPVSRNTRISSVSDPIAPGFFQSCSGISMGILVRIRLRSPSLPKASGGTHFCRLHELRFALGAGNDHFLFHPLHIGPGGYILPVHRWGKGALCLIWPPSVFERSARRQIEPVHLHPPTDIPAGYCPFRAAPNIHDGS